ncbi:hypothetical protein DM02DRAFT_731610 [Periconia macrospinosa]|uniref:Uncharacterized protein n=1 Tax=Periconia macrospinosa TaxID=97972 RepID=A0A2V1DC85_9PLEO|nr:hypothetical protein DM02DRAFT_731610 [Periconia macrospinosa]
MLPPVILFSSARIKPTIASRKNGKTIASPSRTKYAHGIYCHGSYLKAPVKVPTAVWSQMTIFLNASTWRTCGTAKTFFQKLWGRKVGFELRSQTFGCMDYSVTYSFATYIIANDVPQCWNWAAVHEMSVNDASSVLNWGGLLSENPSKVSSGGKMNSWRKDELMEERCNRRGGNSRLLITYGELPMESCGTSRNEYVGLSGARGLYSVPNKSLVLQIPSSANRREVAPIVNVPGSFSVPKVPSHKLALALEASLFSPVDLGIATSSQTFVDSQITVGKRVMCVKPNKDRSSRFQILAYAQQAIEIQKYGQCKD